MSDTSHTLDKIKRPLRLLKNRLKLLVGKRTAAKFHKLYYDNRGQTWSNTQWLGTNILKCPLDIWLYQEIIYDVKPDIIIETGTCYGASAHFMACLCEIIGHGNVVTVDIEHQPKRPSHSRLTYLTGSSISPEIVSHVRTLVAGKNSVLVVLDSDHRKTHVLKEMLVYSEFVTKGSYLIVEDTNINGHPVRADFGDGPWEAVSDFLAQDDRFAIDRQKEKFFLSFNPNGYLRRIG